MRTSVGFAVLFFSCLICLFGSLGCSPAAEKSPVDSLNAQNPATPIPVPPLGITSTFAELKDPPTPERVRLGRWLFYDKRLSADGTISCATCHRPEYAFSDITPVSTGIGGQKGTRKPPCIINQAWTLYPVFFWDGRADSLEAQALGPVANPIEMGNTHEAMIRTLEQVQGYRNYFKEAFGSPEITKDRIAKAIADYERTRMSGNSPWDRWKNGDANAVSEEVKKGDALFFDKASCNQCHLGQNFTDSSFHNLGIGWDAAARKNSDEGRFVITQKDIDRGAFKTPTLRDVAKHPPYMHDGSIATLREVIEHYNKGGNANPHLSTKVFKLQLKADEVDALVKFLEALNGEGYMDQEPAEFPQ